jgi:uncharacterized protein YcbX
VVGRVAALSVFPVKSTAGQSVPSVVLTERGVVHDREWAVYTADGGIASGKTSRRFRKVEGLMAWRSAAPSDPQAAPSLLAPDGEVYAVDDPAASLALSQAFGQALELRREGDVPHHDDCPVHLVTTSSLREVEQVVGGQVAPRRSRANIVLETDGDGFVEDAWEGADLVMGDVVLRLGPGMPRCVMVDMPQAGVPAEPPMLKALGNAHDVLLGLQAHVLRAGTVSLGDDARLVARSEPA